ncbi:MAG: hypothetical protein LBG90_03070 [Spirochaetaceae bacterium]|jgi:hypothetical protein|nr:hypothetical protein [Spirochaetaceae bacterium]
MSLKTLSVWLISGILLQSCALTEGLWNILLVADTWTERFNSDEKIQLFIDNKTDEIILVRALGFDKQTPGVELARIPKQSEALIKVTKGRKIELTGGNSRIRYREITVTEDSETVTVFPVRGPLSLALEMI